MSHRELHVVGYLAWHDGLLQVLLMRSGTGDLMPGIQVHARSQGITEPASRGPGLRRVGWMPVRQQGAYNRRGGDTPNVAGLGGLILVDRPYPGMTSQKPFDADQTGDRLVVMRLDFQGSLCGQDRHVVDPMLQGRAGNLTEALEPAGMKAVLLLHDEVLISSRKEFATL